MSAVSKDDFQKLKTVYSLKKDLASLQKLIVEKNRKYAYFSLKYIASDYVTNIKEYLNKTHFQHNNSIIRLSNSIWNTLPFYIENPKREELSKIQQKIKRLNSLVVVSEKMIKENMNSSFYNFYFLRIRNIVLALFVSFLFLFLFLFFDNLKILFLSKQRIGFSGLFLYSTFKKINEQFIVLEKKQEKFNAEINREKFLVVRFKEILNSLFLGVVLVSKTGKILFMNNVLKKIFSVDDEFIDEVFYDLLKKEDIKDISQDKVVIKNKTFTVFEIENKEGKIFLFEDISEKEKMLGKIMNSERLISIGEMASRITHEIRNPLSTIKLNSEFLAENTATMSPQEVSEALSLIIDEVARLENITGKYMKMVQYKNKEEQEKRLNLSESLIEFVAFYSEELKKRKIDLKIENVVNCELLISQSSFKEILLNIVKNAWEELKEGGTIIISSKELKKFVNIIVEDSGKGVPENKQKQIFENFYTDKLGGTGIGLSHSKKLIEDVGGSITVSKSRFNGAMFIMSFPKKM